MRLLHAARRGAGDGRPTRQLTAGHARPLIGHPRAARPRPPHRREGRSRPATPSARQGARQARAAAPAPRAEKDADTRAIEGELSAALEDGACGSTTAPRGEGGRLTITYKTLEQLDDLLRRLSGG